MRRDRHIVWEIVHVVVDVSFEVGMDQGDRLGNRLQDEGMGKEETSSDRTVEMCFGVCEVCKLSNEVASVIEFAPSTAALRCSGTGVNGTTAHACDGMI
jgi:uncharacterized metal-binding protein